MLLILLAEIAFGIFAAVYAVKLKGVLSTQLDETIKSNYYGDMANKTGVSIAWDIVMYNVCSLTDMIWFCLYLEVFSPILVSMLWCKQLH